MSPAGAGVPAEGRGGAVIWDSVAGYILRSWSAGLFTARHPVLTSMLSSGELVDLRNDTLMVRLTRWQDRMGHLATDSEHLERNREETIRDRLVQVVRILEEEVERLGGR